MIDDKIHVAIKSYRRAGKVSTLAVMPFAWVWVPGRNGKSTSKRIGSGEVDPGRVRRQPVSEEQRHPGSQPVRVDADPRRRHLFVHYFEDGKDHTMTPAQVEGMICRRFDLARQFGVTLWGINQNSDEMAYCTFRPFNLLAPDPRPVQWSPSPRLRYDESVCGKDDYDFWLQTIRRYHRTLRFNKYHYIHDHGKRPGKFVGMRTKEVEEAGIKRMRRKWGDKVFSVGGSPGYDGTGRRTHAETFSTAL